MRGSIERIPYQNYRINVSLPCGPENVDKVVEALLAEIAKIQRDGPQQAELDKVTKAWRENHRIAMRTNGKWLWALKDAALYGTNPEDILSEEEVVDGVSAADIRDAARQYLRLDNYLQAVLYPEK